MMCVNIVQEKNDLRLWVEFKVTIKQYKGYSFCFFGLNLYLMMTKAKKLIWVLNS